MEINPKDIDSKSAYKLLTGSIIPRPIGWISTLSPDGIANLAPYSFFNAIASNPPHVVFSCGITANGKKDTLNNVLATKEFVLNIVTEDTAEAMNKSSATLPSEESEFEFAGVTPIASKLIKAPRVKESPIHFECIVKHTYATGDLEGSAIIVIGEVVHIHIEDAVMLPNYKIDNTKLKAVGRMAGSDYIRTQDVFGLERP